MWELDYKESWALKNWCFWAVVLEKTLESPLDCKEIQLVNPDRNQPWIFIGKTDGWSWRSNTLVTWCEELSHWKIPWCWGRLKAGVEEGDRGWDGWMASPTRWTWVWGVGDRQGSLAVRQSWGCKESEMTEQLDWLIGTRISRLFISIIFFFLWRFYLCKKTDHIWSRKFSNLTWNHRLWIFIIHYMQLWCKVLMKKYSKTFFVLVKSYYFFMPVVNIAWC